jgi:hypothetical protein
MAMTIPWLNQVHKKHPTKPDIKWVAKESNLSSPPRYFFDTGVTTRPEEHDPNVLLPLVLLPLVLLRH